MNKELREKLIQIAKDRIPSEDPSHDIEHTLRVLANAEHIARVEGGDMDVVVPAALFHDLIVHPKDSPKRAMSQEESALAAEEILKKISEYSKSKIENVKTSILQCSFSKGIVPDLFEAKILQDADGLEATGAISVMRTYCSTGQMKRPFYNVEDPFCQKREPDSNKFALDLFFTRLLKVKARMHTKTARKIAEGRTKFLEEFLDELKEEIKGN